MQGIVAMKPKTISVNPPYPRRRVLFFKAILRARCAVSINGHFKSLCPA